jgi:hypothetical protein
LDQEQDLTLRDNFDQLSDDKLGSIQ